MDETPRGNDQNVLRVNTLIRWRIIEAAQCPSPGTELLSDLQLDPDPCPGSVKNLR